MSEGNGHRRDSGIEAELRPAKPCCARSGSGTWCFLEDGHDGPHESIAPTYGPVAPRPEVWRSRKGMQK